MKQLSIYSRTGQHRVKAPTKTVKTVQSNFTDVKTKSQEDGGGGEITHLEKASVVVQKVLRAER
jgi:hypothetical protein